MISAHADAAKLSFFSSRWNGYGLGKTEYESLYDP